MINTFYAVIGKKDIIKYKFICKTHGFKHGRNYIYKAIKNIDKDRKIPKGMKQIIFWAENNKCVEKELIECSYIDFDDSHNMHLWTDVYNPDEVQSFKYLRGAKTDAQARLINET